MYSDFYTPTTVSTSSVDSTWLIISAVLAIVGGIAAYVLFVSQKNKKYTGFVAWLHEFLNFKKYFIEVIIKVMYLITAIYITLGSFSFIGTSVATFFLMLIVGNIVARIGYEMVLMLLTIVNNTTEINKKLSAEKEVPAEKTTKKKAVKETEEE
jgi:hypothetical protein